MKILFVFSLLLGPVFRHDIHGPVQPSCVVEAALAEDLPEPSVVLSEGVVQQFNARRGTGFIKPATSNKLIFVHASDTKERLSANQTVLYTVTKDSKGERAVQVQVKQP